MPEENTPQIISKISSLRSTNVNELLTGDVAAAYKFLERRAKEHGQFIGLVVILERCSEHEGKPLSDGVEIRALWSDAVSAQGRKVIVQDLLMPTT